MTVRPFTTTRGALALALTASLAACGGGGGAKVSPATPGGTGSGTSSSTRLVSSLLLPSKLASQTKGAAATDVGGLVIHVVVNLRNARGLADYAQGASNPQDGRYRNFLTASQIGDQFGATKDDYAFVAAYFASYGLKVGGYPQRLALTVAGPRSGFEAALGTSLAHYTIDGHDVVAPTSTVHFAKPLPVSSIAGAIVDPAARTPQYVRGATTGTMLNGYTPQQVAAAFDFTSAYAAGYTGAGINLGIIGTGPYSPSDINAYKAAYGLAGTGTVNVVVGQSSPAANAGSSPTATPPPVTPPCNTPSNPRFPPSESPSASCNPEDDETQIDTQQASLARDAKILYYLTYVPVECGDPTVSTCAKNSSTGLGYAYQGLAESDDEIQQAIADNDGSAGNGPDILSLSYGGAEIFDIGTNPDGGYDPEQFSITEFAALAAEGVAVFASSGDQGANVCARFTLSHDNAPCVSYPSGDQNVTSVGGITIPMNPSVDLLGPITAWGRQTSSGGASGGGVSTLIPVPVWQTGPNIVTSGRNQPDVSLLGDPQTGVSTFVNQAFAQRANVMFGGTSVSAPQMAAMWALVLQACKQSVSCNHATGAKTYRLGNAAPYFYAIYNSAKYPTTFYDVTFGDNGLAGCEVRGTCTPGSVTPPPAANYVAGTGYDLTTGIGVPFARHLINAVVGV